MKSYTRIILALTFLFGVFAVFKSPGDPDFGWHYKYGEYIVQHGQILRDNVFSYTFTDYKWANSYWISQAVMYLTHHYLGHLWAGLLFAIPLALASIYYVRALGKKLQPGIILATLATLLLFTEFSSSGVTGRPMYFSSLFLMFLIALLLRDDRKRRLWLLPPLFLVWANTHADFTLGLFIFGLYVLDRYVISSTARILPERSPERAFDSDQNSRLAPPHPAKKHRESLLGRGSEALQNFLPYLFVLSFVVTLINPFGIQLWQTLIKESHPYQFKHINEWVPVTTENIPYFATYCAVLGLLVSALIGARQKLPLWYMLALGFFCIFAVRSQYFSRIAVILGIYAFLVFWTPYLLDLKNALSARLLNKLRVGFLAFLLLSTLIVSTLFITDVHESAGNAYWLEKQSYPQEAINYALANGIDGNVFNYYGWGGYMIWKYPQVKTFIDGRMPSWRENNQSVFEDYIKLVDAPAKNIKLLDDYEVSWILYPTDSKFVNQLKSGKSWEELYSDDIATIFVR